MKPLSQAVAKRLGAPMASIGRPNNVPRFACGFLEISLEQRWLGVRGPLPHMTCSDYSHPQTSKTRFKSTDDNNNQEDE
eukprot:5708915-Pyramimonas_sp.AAC.1